MSSCSMLHRWLRVAPRPDHALRAPVERVLDEVASGMCSTNTAPDFTADTLRFVFERAGFAVLAIRRVYDGQYLVLEARPRVSPR